MPKVAGAFQKAVRDDRQNDIPSERLEVLEVKRQLLADSFNYLSAGWRAGKLKRRLSKHCQRPRRCETFQVDCNAY